MKNIKSVITITLYSEAFCDSVRINQEHYDECFEILEKIPDFNVEMAADLLYFADDMFHESRLGGTKQRLRLRIADIATVIPFDDLIELKLFELKKLLDSSKDDYMTIFNSVLLENSEILENASQE